jgi:hypothetical protein
VKVLLLRANVGGATTITLGDEVDKTNLITKWDGPTPERAVQIAQGCRWVDIEPFDRANEQNTLTIEVTRRYLTADECALGALHEQARLRGQWQVFFWIGYSKNWIKNGIVRVTSRGREGMLWNITYQITGGRVRESLNDTL